MPGNEVFRRKFTAAWAAVGEVADWEGTREMSKKTFTILHTNDLHSSLIGMGPASGYTPFTLSDDMTHGGFARLAGLITRRKEARRCQGPVLIPDAGDDSMGTPFGAATRETGGELQLMALMSYEATTLGNHEFDLGPDGLGRSISMAADAGRIPKEAQIYTSGGAVTFTDTIEAAKEMVALLLSETLPTVDFTGGARSRKLNAVHYGVPQIEEKSLHHREPGVPAYAHDSGRFCRPLPDRDPAAHAVRRDFRDGGPPLGVGTTVGNGDRAPRT